MYCCIFLQEYQHVTFSGFKKLTLLYFSEGTKSYVRYHFLNIASFLQRTARSQSCWHGEYKTRLFTRSAFLYVISEMTPATMCRQRIEFVQYEYVYRYTPNIYIYIYIYILGVYRYTYPIHIYIYIYIYINIKIQFSATNWSASIPLHLPQLLFSME